MISLLLFSFNIPLLICVLYDPQCVCVCVVSLCVETFLEMSDNVLIQPLPGMYTNLFCNNIILCNSSQPDTNTLDHTST